MRIDELGARSQPFHSRGQPIVFVQYQSQRAADSFLQRVLQDTRCLGVLCGPKSSGKTTLINQFVQREPAKTAIAIVDGTGIGASELLATILSQFGYRGAIDFADGRLKLLKEIVVREIRANQAPLLVLENFEKLYPSGLQTLRELASLTVYQKFALRIILVNTRSHSPIFDSPQMNPIGTRLVGSFELVPLTAKEALKYLHAKLRASGVVHPHRILPIATCVELHKLSSGWPGALDELALQAIESANNLPVRRTHTDTATPQSPFVTREELPPTQTNIRPDVPRLLVSLSGRPSREFDVKQSKITIGRARLNDLVMNNQYVSKYHAMLVFNNNTMFLVDLKSSNGIYVNSRRVRSTVLRHNDVIEIGNDRIKVFHPLSRAGIADKEPDLADTSIMKTVADMRRSVAKSILRLAPTKREDSN